MRVPHQDRAAEIHGQVGEVGDSRVLGLRLDQLVQQAWHLRLDHVGDHLFGEGVDGLQRKLRVWPRLSQLGAEAELLPRHVRRPQQHLRLRVGRQGAVADLIEGRSVETRPRPAGLLGHISGEALPREILEPAHPAIRRRFPLLRRQQTAVDEHDRRVRRVGRGLKLDIHLIDRHITGHEGFTEDLRQILPSGRVRMHGPSADEKAALATQNERFRGRLDVPERLRQGIRRANQKCSKGDPLHPAKSIHHEPRVEFAVLRRAATLEWCEFTCPLPVKGI